MGMGNWGVGALAVVMLSVMTGASAPIETVAPVDWEPTYNIDPAKAYELVAATPSGATPEKLANSWACDLPITFDYAAGAGIDPATVTQELAYPVRYLQALGYFVGVGEQVPYVTNAPLPKTPGTILVVATNNPDDQPLFAPQNTIAFSSWNDDQTTSAVIGALPKGLSSDVLLHEVGHVLGLSHKDGTVMTVSNYGSIGFDAAETAAIDCRISAGR